MLFGSLPKALRKMLCMLAFDVLLLLVVVRRHVEVENVAVVLGPTQNSISFVAHAQLHGRKRRKYKEGRLLCVQRLFVCFSRCYLL